jgi:hypothetical protein
VGIFALSFLVFRLTGQGQSVAKHAQFNIVYLLFENTYQSCGFAEKVQRTEI